MANGVKSSQVRSLVDFAKASSQPVRGPLAESISGGEYGVAIYFHGSISDLLNVRIEQLQAVTLACTDDDINDQAAESLRHLASDLAHQVAALRSVEQTGIRFELGGTQQ